MGNIEITNTQKLYLLHLLKNRKENNITQVAQAFQCSKPNSKNILDHMILQGFLYKENNQYKMTRIGKSIAEGLEKDRRDLETFLSQALKLGEKESQKYSNDLIGSEMKDLVASFIRKSQALQCFREKTRVQSQDLIECLEPGQYRAYLSIHKNDPNKENSSLEESMAMKGFEEEAKLVIGEEAYLVLEPLAVKKAQDGYYRTGFVAAINYLDQGEEKSVEYKDRKFQIPLEVFKNWTHRGGTILLSSACLTTIGRIGFGTEHRREAIFNIMIDLVNIRKD